MTADTGTVNPIVCGMEALEKTFDEETWTESNLPREDMEYYFMKVLERARGKFNMKQTRTEMTNCNIMNALQNVKVVPKCMLGLYPPDSDTWL